MKGETALVHRIKVKDKQGRVIAEKDVASYAGLLDLAHRERLKRVETRLIQSPDTHNDMTAIVHATIETTRGTFTGIGDANPKNVDVRIVPHIIRMAETRAITRALRVAVNIGVVAVEELGQESGEDFAFGATCAAELPANDNAGARASTPTLTPARDAALTAAPAGHDGVPANGGDNAPPQRIWSPSAVPSNRFDRASDNQRRFLFRLLYERNVTGDAARQFVHKELGVESVQDASRASVSALIDKIKQNGHAAEGG